MSSENPENSPIEIERREGIASIEALNAGSEQKAELILVLLDLKPATELVLYPWNCLPEEAEVTLDKAGLRYARREINKQSKSIAEYAVSKNERLVENLLNCKSHTEYGTLMGYPETAIKAFETKEFYDGPLPEDIDNSIFKMKFSRDHFEEEFETVRRWNHAILEYASNLV